MTLRRSKHYSVVIPTARAGQHVRKSIMSIVKQTLPPTEIIIVLNNYDLETLTEVSDLGREYATIKIYEADVTNCSCATNFGITKADTSIIMRMDADDIAHPRRAEMQLQLIDGGADIVGSSIQCFGDSKATWHVHETDRYLKSLALFHSPLPGPTLTFINNDELRYTPGYNYGDDPAFLFNAIQKNFRLAGVKNCKLSYRVHNNSLSNKKLTTDELIKNKNILEKLNSRHWDSIFGKNKVNMIKSSIQHGDLNKAATLMNIYDVNLEYIKHRLIASQLIKVSPALQKWTKMKSFLIAK